MALEMEPLVDMLSGDEGELLCDWLMESGAVHALASPTLTPSIAAHDLLAALCIGLQQKGRAQDFHGAEWLALRAVLETFARLRGACGEPAIRADHFVVALRGLLVGGLQVRLRQRPAQLARLVSEIAALSERMALFMSKFQPSISAGGSFHAHTALEKKCFG